MSCTRPQQYNTINDRTSAFLVKRLGPNDRSTFLKNIRLGRGKGWFNSSTESMSGIVYLILYRCGCSQVAISELIYATPTRESEQRGICVEQKNVMFALSTQQLDVTINRTTLAQSYLKGIAIATY